MRKTARPVVWEGYRACPSTPTRSPSGQKLRCGPDRYTSAFDSGRRPWEQACSRTAGNRQQNRPTRFIRHNRGGRFQGRCAAHREQARTPSGQKPRCGLDRHTSAFDSGRRPWERACSRTAGNRQQNRPTRFIRHNRGGRFQGRCAAHREQARTPSGQKPRCGPDRQRPLLIRAGGRGSKLARELPGTGSKTDRLGVPDTAEVTCFRAAAQPIRSGPDHSGCAAASNSCVYGCCGDSKTS
ncbi:hypothetical protein BV349_03051 [Pseudomonas syringae pv. actinidiae]|nr:hypothetical protein BV349_03051 [Pseudomonas syringae pv. actinidiae]